MQLNNRLLAIFSVIIFLSMNLPLETIQSTSAESSQDNPFIAVENIYPADGHNHHPSNPSLNGIHTDLIRTSFHGGEYSDNYVCLIYTSSAPTRQEAIS